MRQHRARILRGDRSAMPGAVRASAGINTSEQDVRRLVAAVARIAAGSPPLVPYRQDIGTGDHHPVTEPASHHPWACSTAAIHL